MNQTLSSAIAVAYRFCITSVAGRAADEHSPLSGQLTSTISAFRSTLVHTNATSLRPWRWFQTDGLLIQNATNPGSIGLVRAVGFNELPVSGACTQEILTSPTTKLVGKENRPVKTRPPFRQTATGK